MGKDGIPSLTDPPTVSVKQADFMDGGDRVVGVRIGEAARAYPVKILNYHEIINDTLAGKPIAVVYCPLCDSASVVDRTIGGETLSFGVSGLLYNSNVVMYDRTHEALWSQVGLKALSGPYAGKSLDHRRFVVTTYRQWNRSHPDGSVVSTGTGRRNSYERDPYGDYEESDRLMFGVEHDDERLPKKERVVGVRLGSTTRAYPIAALKKAPKGRVVDSVDGERVVLEAREEGAKVVEAPSDAEVVHTFWFAWAAFHPDTELYTPSDEEAASSSEQPKKEG